MADPYQECPHGVLYEVGRGPESQCLTCRTDRSRMSDQLRAADDVSLGRIEQGLCAREGCKAHNRHLAGYCSPECHQAHMRTHADERMRELEAEVERLKQLLDFANATTDRALGTGAARLSERDRYAALLDEATDNITARTAISFGEHMDDVEWLLDWCKRAKTALAELEGNDE